MSTFLSVLIVTIVFVSAASLLAVQAYTGVPSVPSSASEVADVIALLKQSGLEDKTRIYDLGSGWGTLVIALAHAFPNAQILGIEISPIPYLVARLRTRNLPNVSLLCKDFRSLDLRDAAAVTCYLMTRTMPVVSALLDATLKRGTPVISIAFWFRGRTVSASRQAPMRGGVALYHWPALGVARCGSTTASQGTQLPPILFACRREDS